MARALHGLPSAAWFTACGLPLEPSDVHDARAYLEALGAPAATRIEPVASWAHAERIIRNPVWDTWWWEKEEQERKRLLGLCIERLGEEQAMQTLSLSASVEHEVIHGAAAVAAARAGLSDPALIRAAAGAASMAAHGRTLARLSGEAESHLFVRKFGLFEGGRWPLGLVGGAFHVF
jgi:hypothetical protein